MQTFPVLRSVAVAALFTFATNAAEFDIRNAAEFSRCVPANAKVTKLADGFGFLEGPTWVAADGGHLVFSDIPNNELKLWTAATGVGTYRKPSHNANGNTADPQGRLVTCEHGGRRVAIVTERGGGPQTLVAEFEGKKLNSPNDVVVKSDGTVWFTDPDYGLANTPDKKGKVGKEQPGNFVYRFDPKTKLLAARGGERRRTS